MSSNMAERDPNFTMNPFRQIDRKDLDSDMLGNELQRYGYLLIRNALPKNAPRLLLEEIAEILRRSGWLLAANGTSDLVANAAAACADGDAAYKKTAEEVFNLASFHALPHHAALRRLMEMVVGPELLVHPKSVARLIFPNHEPGIIHAHQDHTAIAGDPLTFSAWMPLHDCPEILGPLQILSGSHLYGSQPTEGTTGYIPQGVERGCDWVSGDINAGDVLLFHSLTVHRAMPNRSTQLRVSLDCRFQSYLRPVNPAVLVFAGSGTRSWESTYQDWSREDLQYYWTRLPLMFKPSRKELRDLALTAEPSRMRERYARIIERIDAMALPWAT